uniref:Cg4702-like protein n=1 Tax=Pseudodiaptomus poplesia TaxID=213370 RepID=A0A0U2V6Y6_9MAXI|nr:cg4702-like protein [Pseudodiaptomus poplesia]
MRHQGLYVLYATLVFTSCFISGYSLPQQRMSADQFARKFGSGPTDNDIISNSIDEEIAVAKEEKGLMATLIEIGTRILPVILKEFSGLTGPSQTDRVDHIDLNGEDPFTMKNILVLGMKIFLAVFSGSSTNQKSDEGVGSPVIQMVMEAIIGALLGSSAKDRSEVDIMAKQATEIVHHLIDLIQVLQESLGNERSLY